MSESSTEESQGRPDSATEGSDKENNEEKTPEEGDAEAGPADDSHSSRTASTSSHAASNSPHSTPPDSPAHSPKGEESTATDAPPPHSDPAPSPSPAKSPGVASEDATHEADGEGKVLNVLHAVIRGDIKALEALMPVNGPDTKTLCEEKHNFNGIKATLLCHALYHHRKQTTLYLLSCPGTNITESEVLFFCMRNCKYDMVLFLLSQPGTDVNQQRSTDGNTILHCACSRPKPPVYFIAELCQLKVLRVNVKNMAGFTPIHLLAQHSKGVEGRDACQLLRAKGALFDTPGPDGRTALQMTRNAYLRQILSLSASGRRRRNPLQLLSSEEKEEVDKVGLDKPLHLRNIDLAKGKFDTEKPLQKVKKMQAEEEAELVNRLYNQAQERAEEAAKEAQRRLDSTQKEARKLTLEEQEETNERLFGMSRDRDDRLQMLLEKYMEPPSEPKCMSPDDLQESIYRLHGQTLEKHKEKQSQLQAKYLPKTLVQAKFGGKRISAEKKGEVAKRLYDESVAKHKETMAKLREQYLQSAKPTKKMTREEWRAMGERLSSK
eukprot:Sspe_Gene.12823::Locus_4390_Transcript_1_1_Confidence_1.000_Length_1851::g.12823::m.12823